MFWAWITLPSPQLGFFVFLSLPPLFSCLCTNSQQNDGSITHPEFFTVPWQCCVPERQSLETECPSVLPPFRFFSCLLIFWDILSKGGSFLFCFNYKLAEELEKYKHELLCALVPASLVACHFYWCHSSFSVYAHICICMLSMYVCI